MFYRKRLEMLETQYQKLMVDYENARKDIKNLIGLSSKSEPVIYGGYIYWTCIGETRKCELPGADFLFNYTHELIKTDDSDIYVKVTRHYYSNGNETTICFYLKIEKLSGYTTKIDQKDIDALLNDGQKDGIDEYDEKACEE